VAVVDLELGLRTSGIDVLNVSKEIYPDRKTIRASVYDIKSPNTDPSWDKLDYDVDRLIELIKNS
jgi:hypothetical protein